MPYVALAGGLRPIKEKRSFNLARDPCKCAFGKWYYSYKANDIGFASVMRKFEVPHRRIHEIADIVLGLAEKGDYQEAEKMIAHTREVELKRVIELFKEATNAFVASQKELAVVLSRGDKHISIAVDFVDAVESIDEKTIERVNLKNASLESDTTVSAARRTKDDGIVFLFDAGQVFDPTVSGLVGFASEDPPCVPPKTRIDRSKIPLPEF